ncbi:MAG: hypothetical protein HY717_23390 [Planctomycetes bacterium]|nr:hypothetical protein [Planctomycetota bacterium]
MNNLTKNTKLIRHSNAVAAGVTTITPSAGVDMKGFDSCTFIAALGAIVAGAATSVEVHQSSDDGVADAYGSLLGSKVTVADDQDNKLVFVEVTRPQKRYLKLIVNRATQNATLDGIVAVLSGPQAAPPTHDSTTVLAGSKLMHAPPEGTA